MKEFAVSLENSLLWIMSELNCSIEKSALQYIGYFLLAEGVQCAVFATSMEYTLYCVVFAANALQNHFLFESSNIKTPSQVLFQYILKTYRT